MKTIKFLVAAILLTIGATTVKAQSDDITFGIKAGVSVSTLRTDLKGITDKSGKVGFNGGVFARTGSTLFFQPEVNFATFSNKYSFNLNKYDAKFAMINVPLLVGYKIINTSNMNLRVSAGPDLYYDLKKPVAPAGFAYKRFSAGAAAGLGVDFGSLTLDARYSLGLSKLNKELGQKANIFSLGVGFKFQ